MKKIKVKKFICEHKTEIYVVVGTAAAIGLAWAGIKYIPKIKGCGLQAVVEVVDDTVQELPHKEIWSNPSGELLTPTGLGSVIYKSNQSINKRLLEHGLQVKLPCGEYRPTELGSKFGATTIKVTKPGHTFSNIEWDKRVLEVICSSDELERAENIRQQIASSRAV